MVKLNLVTNGIEQEKIKEYLENNASETLAEKINNGVKITKDNKELLSKKDLTGFWSYATEEARKITEKGSRSAYVDDNTVYGWAIHYFEEDDIEGTLYNDDGTEYKPATKTITKTENTIKSSSKTNNKNNSQQATLFDMFNFNENKEETEKVNIDNEENSENLELEDENIDCQAEEFDCENEDNEDITEEELQEVLNNENIEEIEEIKLTKNMAIDYETGELVETQEEQPIDMEFAKILYSKLDGKLTMK